MSCRLHMMASIEAKYYIVHVVYIVLTQTSNIRVRVSRNI